VRNEDINGKQLGNFYMHRTATIYKICKSSKGITFLLSLNMDLER